MLSFNYNYQHSLQTADLLYGVNITSTTLCSFFCNIISAWKLFHFSSWTYMVFEQFSVNLRCFVPAKRPWSFALNNRILINVLMVMSSWSRAIIPEMHMLCCRKSKIFTTKKWCWCMCYFWRRWMLFFHPYRNPTVPFDPSSILLRQQFLK